MTRTKPQLSTWGGRLIDKFSFGALIGMMLAVVLSVSTYFYYASTSGEGIKPSTVQNASTEPAAPPLAPSFGQCMYFSIVTFSSLGYGDVVPQGFGRAVVCAEVIAGLLLLSLFVGKLASERTSALIRLLYTSDHQRRLSTFAHDVNQIAREVRAANTDHNHSLVLLLARQADRLLGGIRQYLVFQSSEGGLLEFGNTGPLRALFGSLARFVEVAAFAAKMRTIPTPVERHLGRALQKAASIATDVQGLSADEKGNNTLKGIVKMLNDHRTHQLEVKAGTGRKRPRDVSVITDSQLDNVYRVMPPAPWPPQVHKIVAKRLSIPNRHAQRCIDELIKRGRLTPS